MRRATWVALAAVGLLAGGCSGSSPPAVTTTVTVTPSSSAGSPTDPPSAASTPATSVASSSAPSTAGRSASDVRRTSSVDSFVTPSGNIMCGMDVGGAQCQIFEYDWPNQPCANGMTLSEEGARSACGDWGDTDAVEVSYGTLVRHGDYECEVETTGVTCTNTATDRGFRLSRAKHSTF